MHIKLLHNSCSASIHVDNISTAHNSIWDYIAFVVGMNAPITSYTAPRMMFQTRYQQWCRVYFYHIFYCV